MRSYKNLGSKIYEARRNLIYFICLAALVVLSLNILYRKDAAIVHKTKNLQSLKKGNVLDDESETVIISAEVNHAVEFIEGNKKFILLWTPLEDLNNYLKDKEWDDVIKNCEVTNCYITDNRQFFENNVDKFDAIVFEGQAFKDLNNNTLPDLPKFRSSHQRYIFYVMQSADATPMCNSALNYYFNWTMTYKLNSDIPSPFVLIRNSTGHVIGPRVRTHWIQSSLNIAIEHAPTARFKTKHVLWFPSKQDCKQKSRKMNFVLKLKEALWKYNLNVEIYGDCGKEIEDIAKIKTQYFFFLAMENLDAVDYVTEDFVTSLQNDVAPILVEGADYSKFLPPDSYLDGNGMSPEKLAATIVNISLRYEEFQRLFKWRLYYSYDKNSVKSRICSLCAAVNNEDMLKQNKIYKDIRRWWNPNYESKCKKVTQHEDESL